MVLLANYLRLRLRLYWLMLASRLPEGVVAILSDHSWHWWHR